MSLNLNYSGLALEPITETIEQILKVIPVYKDILTYAALKYECTMSFKVEEDFTTDTQMHFGSIFRVCGYISA